MSLSETDQTPTSTPTTTTTITTTHTTACTLDCPDACTLSVTVADGRITDIDAARAHAPGNPLTQGWICAKVKRHIDRVYAPERVMTPLVRIGAKGAGEFRTATWDEALALVAQRMNETTPEGVVAFTYNSSAAATESNSLTEALFAAVGATRVEHTICALTMAVSWQCVYPDMISADPLDVVHAKLVVIWGANPTVSNTHLAPLVQRARTNGARLVVIDPRRTAMAKRADLHLAVRPGTDAVLALAVANHWAVNGHLDQTFIDASTDGAGELLAEAAQWTLDRAADVCGLDPADIATFAEWYATTKPSMLRIGWGQERNANGGAACRAILALPALGGHFGVLGGGVIGSTGGGSPIDSGRRWPTFDAPPRRIVNMHQIGQWLAPDAGDPCRVLFIQGANPAVMCPDQQSVFAALSRDDIFTVVHEQVLTDTTRFADVVLPATTSFEIDDVAGSYGSYTVQPVRAVINRVGESRSNDELGLVLAQRLGFDWAVPVTTAVDDAGPRVVRSSTIQFVDTMPTGGRARLASPAAPTFEPLERAQPLTLITPASAKTISSMFGEFQSPATSISLHPDDATARDLVVGQRVRVFNSQGSLSVDLAISDDLRPGVAAMAKGIWLRNHPDGFGVNLLIPATADDLASGACFNDTFVEVAAV